LNSIPIPVPSLSEQQRIVTLLDEAFDGIATAKAHTERNLQNARAIFESHLDAVLSRRGDGYTTTTLGAEVDLLPGYAFPSGGYTDAIDAVRLLRGDNIMQGYFRWEEAKGWPSGDFESYSRFALQEGDVVIAMDRPWVKAGLKRAQICPDDLPTLLVQRTSRLRTLGRMQMDFLSHLTGSQSFSRHLLEVQTGIGVPHISGKQIESFKFMLPPMSDQKSIANTLNELLLNTQRLDEIYQQKLTTLDELKKSLLHRAFSGSL
jgi:type I restriction enzyme S subunit